MTKQETQKAEKVTLTKMDQLSIKALIPEPPENQRKMTFSEVMNYALHSQSGYVDCNGNICLYCYAVHTNVDKGIISSIIDGAFTVHEEKVQISPYSEQLIRDALRDNNCGWVVYNSCLGEQVQVSFPKEDAELRRAKIIGGYVLNHIVESRLNGQEGKVEFVIPESGRHLKHGKSVKYYLICIYPSVSSPGYGDAYIREVTFTVDKAVVGTRTICRAMEIDFNREREEPSINQQNQIQTQQGIEFDYPEIDGH